ncbi:SDR family NAD(P)-dependent oxidoreductase [Terricaulis sp.]|uniref:SDR family NAD(P)-dependent oxidoreductase n=1 Tax=Terricaulis sp. TaxID=2768686 RepID=UPI0037845180
MSLRGKSVFVTGANSGIGLATALRFAEEGANVAIFSRRAGANAEACALIEAKGVEAYSFAGDVGDEDAVREAVAATVRAWGGLHYAFNAAGAAQSVTPLTELSLDEYETLMSANARGTFLSMKYEILAIRASGGGAICNCASAAGLIPSAFQVAYAGAKFAVVGMTRGAALECAKDGVRVNVVCPGATTGEMWVDFARKHPDRAALALAKHPMNRVGEKEEVAAAVLFLCRDATFTTGHAFPVDGGRTTG